MKITTGKLVYWSPRILAILYMLFLAMFSLDIFEGNNGFWGTVLGLFMHNIPSLILLGVLLASWKHERFGAIVFTLAGLGMATFIFLLNRERQLGNFLFFLPLIMATPAFLVGGLFALSWRIKIVQRPLGQKHPLGP